jgi:hypothetical protein
MASFPSSCRPEFCGRFFSSFSSRACLYSAAGRLRQQAQLVAPQGQGGQSGPKSLSPDELRDYAEEVHGGGSLHLCCLRCLPPCSPPRLFATSPRISLSMQPVHPSPSYLLIKLIWLRRGGRARCCLAVSIPCRRPPSALTPVGGSSGGRGGNRARRHEGILRAGATGVSRETTDLAGQGSRSK